MKKTIIIALAILVVGAIPSMFMQRRLTDLRENHQKLATEAARLEVSAATSTEAHITKRQRIDVKKPAPDPSRSAFASGFTQLDELKPADRRHAVQSIFASGGSEPGQRDAALASLREYLAKMPDQKERAELRGDAFVTFASNLAEEDFDSATAWIAKAGFTPEEKEDLAAGLKYSDNLENTGRWIEWLSGNLPAKSSADNIQDLVQLWTEEDYQAAGKWLVSTPAGPAKTAAVEAYAITVAGSDPKVAEQWAMTLAPGPARDTTLRHIHQRWPASDPEGAAAFAREHELK